MLRRIAIMVSFIIPTGLLYGGDTVDTYGSFGTGILSISEGKVDQTDSKTAGACSAYGKCNGSKDMSRMGMSTGYVTNKLGFKFKGAEGSRGHIEVKITPSANTSDGALAIRKAYVGTMVGPGEITVGRDTTPFASVIGAADLTKFSDGMPVGPAYSTRSLGLAYNTKKALPVTLKLGYFNTSNPGYKEEGAENNPAIHLTVGYGIGPVNLNLAMIQETHYMVTKDASGNVTSQDGSENASHIAFNVDGSFGMINLDFVYAMGDPIYKNKLAKAKIAKGLKDKTSSMALFVTANLGKGKAALYYGTESASLSKDNGHKNKDGDAADVTEDANTIGLSYLHNWHDLDWVAELTMSKNNYDGIEVQSKTVIGLGVVKTFKSS